jgi:hypothetical protein
MPHRESVLVAPSPSFPRAAADPAPAAFLELRLAVVRITLGDAPETHEPAREALRVAGRNATHAVREVDLRRADDLASSVFFAARAHIAEARHVLAAGRVELVELVRARHRLYRGLSIVAEVLTATSLSRARVRMSDAPASSHGNGVLFAEFVTQVVAATRANPRDIAWVLEVADTELGIASAHPRFARLASDQRAALRTLRGEIVEWTSRARDADAGYSLLNRLMLQADCMNH